MSGATVDFLSKEEIELLQIKELISLLEYLNKNSVFYQKVIKENRFSGGSL